MYIDCLHENIPQFITYDHKIRQIASEHGFNL